jgi:sarcosine oxidase subunit delta
MSFHLTCPNCGSRDVYEFRYGGEIVGPQATPESPVVSNQAGVHKERWFHRFGCRRWLIAERDVRSNVVLRTGWLEGEA